MPEKNIADIVQEILDEKGRLFMKIKDLPKDKLGIKRSASVAQIQKYLEAETGDKFMFRKVDRAQSIIKPCDPSDFVLAALSTTTPKKPDDVKNFVSLLNKKEFAVVLNELIIQGRVRTIYTQTLQPKLLLVDAVTHERVLAKDNSTPVGTYSQEKFKEIFDELNKYRRFVRICDLRRTLNWPREVFDNMVIKLRNSETIQLHSADASTMTPDELKDCFVDENNFIRGLVNWNVR